VGLKADGERKRMNKERRGGVWDLRVEKILVGDKETPYAIMGKCCKNSEQTTGLLHD